MRPTRVLYCRTRHGTLPEEQAKEDNANNKKSCSKAPASKGLPKAPLNRPGEEYGQLKYESELQQFPAPLRGNAPPHFPFNTPTSVLPKRAGLGDTRMPAASIAAIFD